MRDSEAGTRIFPTPASKYEAPDEDPAGVPRKDDSFKMEHSSLPPISTESVNTPTYTPTSGGTAGTPSISEEIPGEDGGGGAVSFPPPLEAGVDGEKPVITGKSTRRVGSSTSGLTGSFFNPRSKFFHRWDVLIAVLLLYTSTVTPFEVSFLETNLGVLFMINRVVDVLFVVDMFWNFNLPIQDKNGEWKTNKGYIGKRYMQGWFTLDLISILPYDIIGYIADNSVASGLKVLRIFRLMRLAKLLRILRAGRMFQRWEATMSIDYAKVALIKFVIVIIMLAHWLGCAWNMVAELEMQPGEIDLPPSERTYTWLAHYQFTDLEDGVWSRYFTSIYWAVATLSTLGYGDVVPTTDAERIFATICAMLGATVYAYIIGNVCSIISGLDVESSKFYALMDGLNSFMREKNIPPDLRVRLRDYFRFQRHNSPLHDGHQLLSAMSPLLKAEVSQILHSKWINQVKCFAGCSQDFIVSISMMLATETFGNGEDVVKVGEAATKMYIVDKGVVACNGRILLPGHTCGEDITFRPDDIYIRNWFARTMTNTVMQVLHQADLVFILEEYPFERARVRRTSIRLIVRETIIAYAKAVNHIKANIKSDINFEHLAEEMEKTRDASRLPELLKVRMQVKETLVDPERRDKISKAIRTMQAAARLYVFRKTIAKKKAQKAAHEKGMQKMLGFVRAHGAYEYEDILVKNNVTYDILRRVAPIELVAIGITLGDAHTMIQAFHELEEKRLEKEAEMAGSAGGTAAGRTNRGTRAAASPGPRRGSVGRTPRVGQTPKAHRTTREMRTSASVAIRHTKRSSGGKGSGAGRASQTLYEEMAEEAEQHKHFGKFG